MQPDLDTAMAAGDLTAARAILDDAAASGGDRQLLIDGYADLAQVLDRRGDHDAAIDALQHAIEHGYDASPDPRSDIAEYHLRAGRADVAAGIWARLREEMPDDVWLYNAAGLSHQEIGAHEHAVSWFTEGLAVAMRTGDPEGLTAQLADLRERSLQALGRPADALQQKRPRSRPRRSDRLVQPRTPTRSSGTSGSRIEPSLRASACRCRWRGSRPGSTNGRCRCG